MLHKVVILFCFFILNTNAAWTEEEANYYKKKYLKNGIIEKESLSFVSQETMDSFAKRYGADALRRLKYINNKIKSLDGVSTLEKIYAINRLVNRIPFITDIKHWKQKDYWARPLETIGTNYGDTEDISLLKYVLMVKAGLNPRDIQLIQKNMPFKKNNKIHTENMSLFYFTKKDIYPLVIDYNFRSKKLYKFNNQFEYKAINISPNKHWNILFKNDLKSTDFDRVSLLEDTQKYKLTKSNIDIFY